LLAALYTFSNNILEYLSAVTNAYHRMDIEGLLKILNRVTIVLFGAVAITTAKPAPLLWAMFLANAICCAVLWILVKRYCVSVRPLWDGEVAKRVLILGLPVAGTLIVSAVYLKWDLLILSSYSIAPEQLGWYAAAFKIVEALSAIPSILGAALFPTLVQLRHSDPGKLDRLLSMTTKAMLLVSIPVAAIISALSEILIYRVYGSAYLPGARVLAVLIWCIVPMFVYYYLIFVNVASGKAAYNLIAGCLALVAGLITNMILIPRIGYTGAAWAALAANACFALIASWKVSRTFPNAGIQKLLLKMSVVTLGMAGPIWLMPAALPIRVAAGCLSYAGVVVLLRGITQEEVRFALRIVQLRPAVEGAGG
jgi:O-antigen/teichoic acid export membrane protein